MRLLFRVMLLMGLLAISWTAANASFCSTFVGSGVCISGSGTSGGIPVSGSAVFQVNGSNLDITLINDAGSSASMLGGAQVMTAVLFDLSSAAGTLTNVGSFASLTAPLIGTASLTVAETDSLSQNWSLGSGVSAFGFSNLYSVDSTGLNDGVAGGKANLGGCTNTGAATDCRVLDGPPWGLIPHVNAGGHASGNDPLVNYFAFFSLAGLGAGLTNAKLAADLSNVVFQYGTSSGEGPGLTGSCTNCGQSTVPEPSHLAFLLLASLLIAYFAWRRKRAEA